MSRLVQYHHDITYLCYCTVHLYAAAGSNMVSCYLLNTDAEIYPHAININPIVHHQQQQLYIDDNDLNNH